MQVGGPVRTGLYERRRAILSAMVLAFLCVAQAHGQDVAEAARQEKERKPAEPKPPQHVYTEEDLKRQVILTPEDRARVEAPKQQKNNSPAEENVQRQPSGTEPLTDSLGEIARRYRQEKAGREAKATENKKFAPFPYTVPDTSLAEPSVSSAPLSGPILGIERNGASKPPVPNLGPESSPRVSNSHGRISPFQPRPLNAVPASSPLGFTPEPVPPRPATPLRPVERSVQPQASTPGLRQIEVQPGQSWWKLAELYLGNGARWPELRNMNANADDPPELLKLGSRVMVPEVRRSHETSSPQTVTVKRGDSLWSLAQEYLGRGTAWSCLASANPQIVEYTRIPIGTSVRLPEGRALRSCRTGIPNVDHN
jgi:nucleoid-associated protein YgaU